MAGLWLLYVNSQDLHAAMSSMDNQHIKVRYKHEVRIDFLILKMYILIRKQFIENNL